MKVSRKKVAIIGNSVAIKMRPKRQSKNDKTFSELIFDDGYEVNNFGKSGTIVTESFKYIDDEIICNYPDFLIVIYGVVEAFPRHTLRNLNNFNIINYYNNANFERNFINPNQFSIFRLVARLLNGFMRRITSATRLQWLWLSQNNFAAAIHALCGLVLTETNSNIILLGVPAIPQDNDKFSVKANSSINAFNSILRAESEYSPRIHYVDVTETLSEEQLAVTCPDGIHFSAFGHRLLHEAIISIMTAKDAHRNSDA